jgi:hypothetical protein
MDDAFTRVRVILMNGIESEALRFGHACARVNGPLQPALAQVRRIEQHQQTMVNWLNPADQDPLDIVGRLLFASPTIRVLFYTWADRKYTGADQISAIPTLEDMESQRRFLLRVTERRRRAGGRRAAWRRAEPARLHPGRAARRRGAG